MDCPQQCIEAGGTVRQCCAAIATGDIDDMPF